MNPERLDFLWRDGIGFDLENHLAQPGLRAPPIVCGSLAEIEAGQMNGRLLSVEECRQVFETILRDPRYTLVGANISYDVICLIVDFAKRGIDICPLVFAMYDAHNTAVRGQVDGRVICVQVFEILHAIAKGHLGRNPYTLKQIIDPETKRMGAYSLREVVKQVLGRDNAKVNDIYRKAYALLEHIPMSEWPMQAKQYPVDDAINTFEAALGQAGLIPNVGPHEFAGTICIHCGCQPGTSVDCRSRYRRFNAHELSRQTYSQFCLSIGAAWGYHVNQVSVTALEEKYDAEHKGQLQPFIDAGIIRADGTENQSVVKKLVATAYGSKDPCSQCAGTGKVPSPKTNGRTKINCKHCNGTALELTALVPRSEADQVGMSRDALTESGNEFLRSYAEYGEAKKIKTVYIPYLRNTDVNDIPHPEAPLTLRPNSLVETGRVSYYGATMLLPREGGVRECIEARPGYLFSSEDYKAGELVAHAQSCLWIVGGSELAKALNLGLDAHLALAGTVLGIPYEEMKALKKAGDKRILNTRQAAKPPNFGFPGRMGAVKLVIQQRKANGVDTPHPNGPAWISDGHGGKIRGYKGLRFCILMNASDTCGDVMVNEWKGRSYNAQICKKCIECAEQLKINWLRQWPENVPYFAHVKRIDESGQPIIQHVSKRIRGFRHGQVDDDGNPINSGNAIANGYFQAIIADAAKNAHMAATRECYDRTIRVVSNTNFVSAYEGLESPLYGSRLPAFQHDEVIGEHPESIAHDAATRLSELLEESLRIMCPDMHKAVEAMPTLMRKLYKGAEPLYQCACGSQGDSKKCKCGRTDGRLIPWEPKKKAA